MSTSKPLLRWRGRLNLKDITERVIASVVAGATMAVVFFGLGRIFE